MQRYYFHIRRGDTITHDPDGSEFASISDAEAYAVKSAREILAEKVIKGEVVDGETFEVTDESGQVALRVPLRSVIRLD